MGKGSEYKDDKEHNTSNNNTNLFRKYIHDIRNMQTLNTEMINNIRHMSNEEKMQIIIVFNDIVENMNALLQ